MKLLKYLKFLVFIFIVLVKMARQTSILMEEFFQSTTLHGYSYLSNTDSIVTKILWGIVIVAATMLGITYLVINTNAYMNATIVTNIESETFPLDVSNLFQI